jgi:hypothetical protein
LCIDTIDSYYNFYTNIFIVGFLCQIIVLAFCIIHDLFAEIQHYYCPTYRHFYQGKIPLRRLHEIMLFDLYKDSPNTILWSYSNISYKEWFYKDWLFYGKEQLELWDSFRINNNSSRYFKEVRKHLLYTWHGTYYKSIDNFSYHIFMKRF